MHLREYLRQMASNVATAQKKGEYIYGWLNGTDEFVVLI
jgi:hypothetical protein